MAEYRAYVKKVLRQFIVIGNGFDLECGLKSQFGDFLEPRRPFLHPSESVLLANRTNPGEYKLEHGITVWDAILESYSDYLWNDIEKAIKVWVAPDSGDYGVEEACDFQNVLRELNPAVASRSDQVEEVKHYNREYLLRMIADSRAKDVVRFIRGTTSQPSEYWCERTLRDYLYEQLKLLEVEFCKYLSAQVSGDEGYYQNAWRLMTDLLASDLCEDDKMVETTVLSFNYTNPLKNKPAGIPLVSVNVHGDLNGEIVFGIDGKDLLDNDQVVRFTKTYRLLGLHSKDRLTIFNDVGARGNSHPIEVIKFYGHSLSEPDYSYFQAIFDEVDLYSSSTRLIFYYRNHSGEEDARAKTNRKVSRLLYEYGRTMDNKDHGKNLMHKLILEGRLSVLELKKAKPGD